MLYVISVRKDNLKGRIDSLWEWIHVVISIGQLACHLEIIFCLKVLITPAFDKKMGVSES